MCETKLLSLKKEVYELESCQREVMGLTMYGLEYSNFRDVLEYRSHFERQLGYQNEHFSQEIFTHGYMPTFKKQPPLRSSPFWSIRCSGEHKVLKPLP